VSGAYANFLTGATDADVAAVYPSPTYERLASVKRRYDPDNLFTGNLNVRPR
jgi:FAD/FMN-containing dehydrogenase